MIIGSHLWNTYNVRIPLEMAKIIRPLVNDRKTFLQTAKPSRSKATFTVQKDYNSPNKHGIMCSLGHIYLEYQVKSHLPGVL